MLVVAPIKKAINIFIKTLSHCFNIKIIGKLSHFLSYKLFKDKKRKIITIS